MMIILFDLKVSKNIRIHRQIRLLIVANRIEAEINEVSEKVFTVDILGQFNYEKYFNNWFCRLYWIPF